MKYYSIEYSVFYMRKKYSSDWKKYQALERSWLQNESRETTRFQKNRITRGNDR